MNVVIDSNVTISQRCDPGMLLVVMARGLRGGGVTLLRDKIHKRACPKITLPASVCLSVCLSPRYNPASHHSITFRIRIIVLFLFAFPDYYCLVVNPVNA